jgi:hypothetical protein
LAPHSRRIDHERFVLQQLIETLVEPYTDVLALLRENKILPPASEVWETRFVLDERSADKLRRRRSSASIR